MKTISDSTDIGSPPAKSPRRQIVRLATPVAGSGLVTFFVSANDTVLLGQSGASGVAAGSAATSINYVFVLFLSGLTGSVQILVARRRGAGDEAGGARATSSMLALACSLSIFLLISVIVVAPWLLGEILHGSDVPVSLATNYLRILAFTLPLIAVGAALRNYATGLGRGRMVFVSSAISCVVDIGLALLLIKLGSGPLGVAFATLAGAVSPVVVGACWLFATGVHRPAVRHISREELLAVWRMGWPEAILAGCSAGSGMVVTILLATAGSDALAQARGLTVATMLVFTLLYSLGIATTTVAAHCLGAGDQDGFRQTVRQATITMLWVAGACAAILGPLSVPLLHIVINDANVTEIATSVVLLAWLQVFWMAVVVSVNAFLRAHGDTRTPLRSSLIGEYVVFLPLGWLLCRILDLGLIGVFAAHHVFWATYFMICAVALRRSTIQRQTPKGQAVVVH